MNVQSTQSFGEDQLKFLIAAPSGFGKTTLLASTGEPTLILSAEAGLLSVKQAKKYFGDSAIIPDFIDLSKDDSGNTIPKEKRIFRLEQAFDWLNKEEQRKKYRWVCLDSLTEIGENVFEWLSKEFPDRKDAMVLWGEYFKQMRGIIKSFRDLPSYNIVLTSLTTKDKNENGQLANYISLSGQIAEKAPAYFDEVFYIHKRLSADGQEERVLLTEGTEMTPFAKDRSGCLEKFETPNLRLIANKIKKGA